MFTKNYYNIKNFIVKYCGPAESYSTSICTAAQCKELTVYTNDETPYYLSPNSTALQFAQSAIMFNNSNLFPLGVVHLGYAADDAEMDDLSPHSTAITSISTNRHVTIEGEEGHQYLVHNFSHAYRNEQNTPVTLNKVSLSCLNRNVWSSNPSTSATTQSQTGLWLTMFIDRIANPIVVQPGENVNFIYRLKVPLF